MPATRLATYAVKGGVGKTTTALGLAGAAALRGDRVLVVDCDPHGRAAHHVAGERLVDGDGVRSGAGGWYGVSVVRWTTGPAPDLDGYDLVLLDCPPNEELSRPALALADKVVVPVLPESFAIDGLAEVLDTLDADADYWVVTNQMRRGREPNDRLAELREEVGDRLLEPPIRRREAVPQAHGALLPLPLYPGQPAREVADVFEQLLEALSPKESR